jgi:hypothetical protein
MQSGIDAVICIACQVQTGNAAHHFFDLLHSLLVAHGVLRHRPRPGRRDFGEERLCFDPQDALKLFSGDLLQSGVALE